MFSSTGLIIVLVVSTLIIVGAGAWIIKFLALAREHKEKKAQELYNQQVIWRFNKLVERINSR